MTTLRTIILSAAVTFALPSAQAMAAAGDGWGASWSFGPVKPTTSNYIIYAKTTMVPGRLPVSYWSSTSVGPLFLWPGLSNPTSDLIQTTMDAWSGTENSSYCSGNGSQWCVEASVFGSFGQTNGPTVAIDPTDHVTIEYALGTDNETWTQTVTSQKLGKVVSTLQTAAGEMPGSGFGFATEADAYSFTVDTCYYLCTEILLAAADPDFGATGGGANGGQQGANGTGSGPATATNLHTPDNGLTWLVDLITIPAMYPQGTQTPTPTYDCSSSTVDAGAGGSGGSGGTGGAGGSGGTSAGGAGGNAGAGGAGGTAGAGGAGGSGGTAGAGGSGGSGGTGGAAGSGGSGGTAGAGGSGGTSAGGSGGSAGTVGAGGSGGSVGTVNAGGSGSPGSDAGGNGLDNGSPSGCGCRAAGNSCSRVGYARLFGLLGLAFVARRRRRCTTASH